MPPVSAPLTTPTANTGAHAQGVLLAAQGLQVLQKAMALVDPTSALGQAIATALRTVGKQVGSPPAEQQVTSLQSQLLDAQRSAMQRVAMMQQQAAAQRGAPQPQSQAQPQPSPMAA